MPWIGAMDVSLGLTMAVVPLRIVLLHLTIWGIWTAVLRPLSGDAMWECLERAGNYGVPLAFLVLAGVPCRHRRLRREVDRHRADRARDVGWEGSAGAVAGDLEAVVNDTGRPVPAGAAAGLARGVAPSAGASGAGRGCRARHPAARA